MPLLYFSYQDLPTNVNQNEGFAVEKILHLVFFDFGWLCLLPTCVVADSSL